MLSNISPWQLLIVLAIVIMIFGTKKLRSLGSDLGSAVKGFKKAVNNEEQGADKQDDSKLEEKHSQSAQTHVKSEEKTKDSV